MRNLKVVLYCLIYYNGFKILANVETPFSKEGESGNRKAESTPNNSISLPQNLNDSKLMENLMQLSHELKMKPHQL